MASEAKEMADYETMLQLLCGYRVKNGRQLPAKYPTKNSSEERRAKAALAQYVNRKIPGFVGHLLALAIDPQMQPHPGMKRTRSIKFESPSRGKNIEWARHLKIVSDIQQGLIKQGAKLKPGQRLILTRELDRAGDRYNITREAAHKIWMSHPLGQSWADYFGAKTKYALLPQ
jgi:hypothetical protein